MYIYYFFLILDIPILIFTNGTSITGFPIFTGIPGFPGITGLTGEKFNVTKKPIKKIMLEMFANF